MSHSRAECAAVVVSVAVFARERLVNNRRWLGAGWLLRSGFFICPICVGTGTAVVGGGVCLHDPCFQTRAAGCELVEPRLYALPFDLQLAPPLLAQFFRARAPDSRQTFLDVLGF